MMNEIRMRPEVRRCWATGHIMLHLSLWSPRHCWLLLYMRSCGSTETEVTAEEREYNILRWQQES